MGPSPDKKDTKSVVGGDSSMSQAPGESATNNEPSRVCMKCNNSSVTWHCSTCNGFHLCDTCHHQEPLHPHPMEQIIPEAVAEPVAETGPGALPESVERILNQFLHSIPCKEDNCAPWCDTKKKVIHHINACKKRDRCPICKQFMVVIVYHAKRCTLDPCPVPFCMNIQVCIRENDRPNMDQLVQALENLQIHLY